MKRQLTGLNAANHYLTGQIPDGIYLVSVRKTRFHRQARKPYYTLDVVITEPVRFVDRVMSSRIYCNQRALWKINWLLRDFAYDPDLLERDEIDEKRLIGLRGVVKVRAESFPMERRFFGLMDLLQPKSGKNSRQPIWTDRWCLDDL